MKFYAFLLLTGLITANVYSMNPAQAQALNAQIQAILQLPSQNNRIASLLLLRANLPANDRPGLVRFFHNHVADLLEREHPVAAPHHPVAAPHHPIAAPHHPVVGLGHPVAAPHHPVVGLGHPVVGLGHPVVGLGHPVVGLGHPAAHVLVFHGPVHPGDISDSDDAMNTDSDLE